MGRLNPNAMVGIYYIHHCKFLNINPSSNDFRMPLPSTTNPEEHVTQGRRKQTVRLVLLLSAFAQIANFTGCFAQGTWICGTDPNSRLGVQRLVVQAQR